MNFWSFQILTYNACEDITAAHGHRNFIDNYGIVVEFLGDATCRALNVAHVRSALIGTGGGIDGDKNKVAIVQCLAIAGCEMQTSCSNVAFDHFFQPGLINRQNALLKFFNFLRDNIDTGYLVTHIRKAGTCDQAYITCTNYTNCCHYITPNSYKWIFILLFYDSGWPSMSGEDHQVIFKRIELFADRFLDLLVASTFKICAPDTAIEKGITAEHAKGTAHQADTAWSMPRRVHHYDCDPSE